MILLGTKKEEYRERSDYWLRRLCFNGEWKNYDAVMFHEGYRREHRTMLVKFLDIGFGVGRGGWGAEEGIMYIVIKLGKVLMVNY